MLVTSPTVYKGVDVGIPALFIKFLAIAISTVVIVFS